MITQEERDKLNQWYADYSANNAKPMDYVTWLEYMLVHRSSLLQQSAEYTDSLEDALNSILEEIPNPTLPVTKAIAAIAKDALTEAE